LLLAISPEVLHYFRLSYRADTTKDFGTVLCWATNHLGETQKPCEFALIPAGMLNKPLTIFSQFLFLVYALYCPTTLQKVN